MKKVHKADLSQLGKRWAQRMNPDRTVDLNHVGVPAGAGELPYDFPAFIEVFRVMDHEHRGVVHTSGVVEWQLRVSVVGGGPDILLRIVREPRATFIEIDGDDIWAWDEDWEYE